MSDFSDHTECCTYERREPTDHPASGELNRAQWFACEHPERPAEFHTLWHASCPACLIALQAALASTPGLLLMSHEASWR